MAISWLSLSLSLLFQSWHATIALFPNLFITYIPVPVPISTACEVDIGTGTGMYVMNKFGNNAIVACQDWNNNDKDKDNQLIAMHCGPHDTEWLDPNAVLRDGYEGSYVET